MSEAIARESGIESKRVRKLEQESQIAGARESESWSKRIRKREQESQKARARESEVRARESGILCKRVIKGELDSPKR